jgi:hypothetical protein
VEKSAKMSCFGIYIHYPVTGKRNIDRMNEKFLFDRTRHIRAPFQILDTSTLEMTHYYVVLCYEDVVQLIKDLHYPFYIARIEFMAHPYVLFVNRYTPREWLKTEKQKIIPKGKMMKDIYWLATSTERWTPH